MESYSLLIRVVSALFVSFLLGVILSPIVISAARKLKAVQPILTYIDQHAEKRGTPTFGGFIFLLPAVFVSIAFLWTDGLSVGMIAMLVTLSFSVIGFLDDYIKIKTKDNMGLRPYQKILGQIAIAIIVAVYAYKSEAIGSRVYIPFLSKPIDFGFWYIPFAVFVYLALSNCVNLTDGVDGLASNCSVVYLLTFEVIFLYSAFVSGGEGTLAVFTASLLGGVIAFLLFNTNKAQIFMGDTGSLALGGASAAIALFSGQPFLILLVGIMYVVSGISIILQVSYFKVTHGKRIFLMAPYHHHLEKKGWSEARICTLYATVTFLMGLIAILSVVSGHAV